MLDIKYLRQNIGIVRKKMEERGQSIDFDRFLELDAKRRDILQSVETLRNERNDASKAIGTRPPRTIATGHGSSGGWRRAACGRQPRRVGSRIPGSGSGIAGARRACWAPRWPCRRRPACRFRYSGTGGTAARTTPGFRSTYRPAKAPTRFVRPWLPHSSRGCMRSSI